MEAKKRYHKPFCNSLIDSNYKFCSCFNANKKNELTEDELKAAVIRQLLQNTSN